MTSNSTQTPSSSQSWQDILEEVREWQKPIQEKGYPIWYRGQRDSVWFARSGLHRHSLDCFAAVGQSHEQPGTVQLLRMVYATLYFKFKGRAWRFLEQSERSPWGILFAMQHYGLPTLLLDWTESLACAIYFVQQGRDPKCDAALYLLDPQVLNAVSMTAVEQAYRDNNAPPVENKLSGDGLIALGEVLDPNHYSSYFHPEHPQFHQIAPAALGTVSVAPFFSNPRMLAQQAAFTMSNMSFLPLEEQFDESVIKKIILPAETYSDAQNFLDLVGISHFGYFPDISNLVRDLKDGLDRELEQAIDFVSGRKQKKV